MTSCAAVPNSCSGWARIIQPDDGFEERWTHGEKQQAVYMNRNVQEHCR